MNKLHWIKDASCLKLPVYRCMYSPHVILQWGCSLCVCVSLSLWVAFSSYTLRIWKEMLAFEPFAHSHSCTRRLSLSTSLQNARLQPPLTRWAGTQTTRLWVCTQHTPERLTFGLHDTHDEDTDHRGTCSEWVFNVVYLCGTEEALLGPWAGRNPPPLCPEDHHHHLLPD